MHAPSGHSELEAQAAALREAVKRGTQREAAPLEPGAYAWVARLSTKGRQGMVLQGGRRGAREGGKGVEAAADGAARKVHVQVLQGKLTGRVVRAWPRHVWPTAPADPVAAPLEYDADEVGSLHHEPSPPPSPCARVGWPSYGHSGPDPSTQPESPRKPNR
jgi:hypothetical protein